MLVCVCSCVRACVSRDKISTHRTLSLLYLAGISFRRLLPTSEMWLKQRWRLQQWDTDVTFSPYLTTLNNSPQHAPPTMSEMWLCPSLPQTSLVYSHVFSPFFQMQPVRWLLHMSFHNLQGSWGIDNVLLPFLVRRWSPEWGILKPTVKWKLHWTPAPDIQNNTWWHTCFVFSVVIKIKIIQHLLAP